MSSWFVSGKRGYCFKTAYDETMRSYAPERLLMRAVADAAERTPELLFDTCARRDAPADPLWPQACEIAHYPIAIGSPAGSACSTLAMRAAGPSNCLSQGGQPPSQPTAKPE